MPQTYAYKVRDRTGTIVTGQLVGDSESLVLQRLREMGLTPVEVKKTGTGLSMEINVRPGHVKLKQIAVFCRQFATMVNSGLPILRALSILADQTDSKELAKVLVQSRTDVEQGASLSAAMAKHPKAFNNLFISMIKAGETGGVLDDVLLSLADQIEKEVELRRQIKSAMTYPVVVVVMVLLILSAMLLFIVPQFETIYANLGGQLPLPTRILLTVSNAFRNYWYIVGLASVGGWFALKRYRKTPNGRARVDALKIRVPVFGPLFHKVALARFSATLAMLMRAGVPILQALDNVKETVNNRVIADAVDDVKTSVREGESIAKPLAKHKVFPPMVVQMIAVGEETGSIDTMLAKVAEFYNSEVTATVDALTSLIEPLLIAIIGGAVGAAVIALYMPMFNVINLLE
ncbi:MAG TPA: type II secretion system F family protein [Actinomycetota bacterium]|jgi:type IV pilus assembly protein PilC